MSETVARKIETGLREALAYAKADTSHSCNCIGPQIGQPLCPCMMRNVTIENGRYVQRRDLGPAPAGEGTIGNPDQLQKLFRGVKPA